MEISKIHAMRYDAAVGDNKSELRNDFLPCEENFSWRGERETLPEDKRGSGGEFFHKEYGVYGCYTYTVAASARMGDPIKTVKMLRSTLKWLPSGAAPYIVAIEKREENMRWRYKIFISS